MKSYLFYFSAAVSLMKYKSVQSLKVCDDKDLISFSNFVYYGCEFGITI